MCGPGLDTRVSQQQMNRAAAEMYAKWREEECDCELYRTEDAEVIVTAYGISGRIAKSAVNILRGEGIPRRAHPPAARAPLPGEGV